MLYLKEISPATSIDSPDGGIVLQKDYLTLPDDSRCGIPGFLQSPTNNKSLQSPSYNLVTEGVSFAGHEIFRCIITPASDITIIPMNLQGYEADTTNEFQIYRTRYILKSFEENSSCMMSGYRINVNIGLVLRSVRDLAQRFQIDGAVLLDPGFQDRALHPRRSVCLLGMDFIMKYPYLFYIPRFDSSGMVDFMIARDPFASRPYSVQEQFYKTVIVHVDGHYNKDTGSIGCGIFFKSGSVFNMLSGVSKYDKAGVKHTKKLKERGILMAIIKALHVVRTFPVGRDFRGVIIRSTDPAIARLMAVTQVTMRNVFADSKKSDEDSFDPMEGGYYYPTTNRDLMLDFCHTFLRSELGFKITFEDSKSCSGAIAASLLATAGSRMEEFCMGQYGEDKIKQDVLPFLNSQAREINKDKCYEIKPLGSYEGFEESPLYISLGIDGYFHIKQEKAHAAMEAADKAGLNTGDIENKEAVAILSEEYPVEPNGLADINKTTENDQAEVVYAEQSLQKDSDKFSKDELHKLYPIRMGCIGYREKGNTDFATLNQEQGLERNGQDIRGVYHGMHGVTPRNPTTEVKETERKPGFKGIEESIRASAKAKISRIKTEGLFKYESLEGQMANRIALIKEEGQKKRRKIIKETETQIIAMQAEYIRKRNMIVSETSGLITDIDAAVPREIEMVRLRMGTGIGGKKNVDMLKVDEDKTMAKNFLPSALGYMSLSDKFSESSECSYMEGGY